MSDNKDDANDAPVPDWNKEVGSDARQPPDIMLKIKKESVDSDNEER